MLKIEKKCLFWPIRKFFYFPTEKYVLVKKIRIFVLKKSWKHVVSSIIDIGQIEGAFAQGYGLFMLEQMIHSPDGVLLTRGPGAYKLPGKNRKLRSKLYKN